MATTKGIDIRTTGGTLVFRASQKDSSGAKLTTGTTTLRLLEIQDDGTFKTYDFSSNTFKTTAPTTDTLALTHRQASNNTVNTGLWTGVLATLTGFTPGAVCIAQVSNSGASPADQEREFQYGLVEGDMVAQTGDAYARIGAAGAGLTALGDTRLAFLDAAITSRATVSAVWAAVVDSAGVTTLLSRIASALNITSGKVDVNDKTGFSLSTAPPTAIQVRQEMDSNSTKLDVAVSTRNATTPPTAASIASAVWGSVSRTLTALGFTGVATEAKQDTAQTSLDAIADDAARIPATPASQGDVTAVGDKVDTAQEGLDALQNLLGVYTFTPPTAYPGTGILVVGEGEGSISFDLTFNADKQVTSRALSA